MAPLLYSDIPFWLWRCYTIANLSAMLYNVSERKLQTGQVKLAKTCPSRSAAERIFHLFLTIMLCRIVSKRLHLTIISCLAYPSLNQVYQQGITTYYILSWRVCACGIVRPGVQVQPLHHLPAVIIEKLVVIFFQRELHNTCTDLKMNRTKRGCYLTLVWFYNESK
ncbi:uncharacterized protein EI90DRAFT_1534935 [Cantharellus anzutake]|uniref:uncharacterized protein n=1 Tax=Cantharellus anzutake TaxID=1750568 RepID=UPI001907D467|nr:uncharacterized protein EI90DRAFT_1534935 [Cantharellus anzutake]KAF8328559.1 hypothetical protein EI90DRAFT_1534935 [Cantharellus anzutake]